MRISGRIASSLRSILAAGSLLAFFSACAQNAIVESDLAPQETREQHAAASYEKILSYQDCVNAGFPSTKSLPPRCSTPDGRVFVAELKRPPKPVPVQVIVDGNGKKISGSQKQVKPDTAKATCKDTCGDGVCAEMVCQALGCPCAENTENCPQDCKK